MIPLPETLYGASNFIPHNGTVVLYVPFQHKCYKIKLDYCYSIIKLLLLT